jgi:SAM-dependent methyltransferase
MARSSPITRQTLLENLQAYKKTSVLRAAVELKVYDVLDGGDRTPAEVAAAIGVGERAARILLGALAAVGLAESSSGETFGAPEGASRFLVSTSPEYSGGSVRVLAADWEWDAMRNLADVARKGHALLQADLESPGFPYWHDFAEQATFVTHTSATALVDSTAAWMTGRTRPRVLDLGCGHALFGCLLAQRHPEAEVVAMDWATVLPAARAQAERIGVGDRVTCLAGDALIDPLGGPYDLIVLANLLPMFSADQGVRLLQRVAGELAPDGRIAIVGFTTGTGTPADERSAWILSLTMLAGTTGGEAHPVGTYRSMLAAAGLLPVDERRVGELPIHLIVAERASRTTESAPTHGH